MKASLKEVVQFTSSRIGEVGLAVEEPLCVEIPGEDDSMSLRELENETEAVFGWFRIDLDGGKNPRSLVSIDLDDSYFDAGDAGDRPGERDVDSPWNSFSAEDCGAC
jgi:hypothetical protein